MKIDTGNRGEGEQVPAPLTADEKTQGDVISYALEINGVPKDVAYWLTDLSLRVRRLETAARLFIHPADPDAPPFA